MNFANKLTRKMPPMWLSLLCMTLSPSGFTQVLGVPGTGTLPESAERAAPSKISSEADERASPTGTFFQAETIKPFGHHLFQGSFRNEREDGVNPEYRIEVGDQISVKTWGATTFDGTLTVDSQGNIFMPEIGPIRISGIRNSELNRIVKRAVRTVFTQNVDVYTNLQGTQPVVVYVTGYVQQPGTYAGVATDSVLYFLDRAGGVDLKRGSFRDIKLTRKGKITEQIDLYRFLLTGDIAKPQFRDGDTLVVSPRKNTVMVSGEVRNAFEFEFTTPTIGGDSLAALAIPEPQVSHASVLGLRNGTPTSVYITYPQLLEAAIRPGDRVVFEGDLRERSMMVRVEGTHLGLSRYAIPTDTRLHTLLAHIPVDPNLTDTSAISIRRASVAKRQKTAIAQSLTRLEAVALGATSQTEEEASIRVKEAELITRFVARARRLEPKGVLVVARSGEIDNVLLQPGDIVTIPEKNGTVLVSGEVLAAQALVFRTGTSALSYVEQAGGYTERADAGRFLIIRRNAEVIQGNRGTGINEGDEIVVLPKVPVKNLQLAKTIVQVVYQLALSTAIALGL